jgi:pimeloyl-ACP methyl ester carboxylesterase
MLRVSTVELAHDEAGAGPAVVLIHGHPFNRSMWAPQVAALRDSYRVIVPDLRGYGESPVTRGTVTMRELAADVDALLGRLGVTSAVLVGLSMGGLVVMELATAARERWTALGLIATTAAPLTAAERASRLERADTAERAGMRPLADEMAARLFGPEPDPAVVDQVMAMMLATSPAGAAAALRGRAERPDYRPLLRELDLDALVCVGDRDTYSDAAVTAELTASLRRPRLVVLRGVGHLPNLERPRRFNAELGQFLAGTTAGPASQP